MSDEVLDSMVTVLFTALITTSLIVLAVVTIVGVVYYVVKCLIGYMKEVCFEYNNN